MSAEDRLPSNTPVLATLAGGGSGDHPCGAGAGLLALTAVAGLGAAQQYLLDSVGHHDV